MRQVNFGNSDSAAALASKHAAVFDQTFRDVRLAHRSTDNISTMPRRDDVYRTRGRNVCDYDTLLIPQTNVGDDGQRHLLREWLAAIGDDSESLTVGIVRETNGCVSCFYHRTKLRHRLELRLRSVRERCVRIVVNCENFASQPRQPFGTENEHAPLQQSTATVSF